MKAKEQFEKLGYVHKKERDIITYTKKENEGIIVIDFDLLIKEYDVDYEWNGVTSCYLIDILLHKAINKQMEELGWIDE